MQVGCEIKSFTLWYDHKSLKHIYGAFLYDLFGTQGIRQFPLSKCPANYFIIAYNCIVRYIFIIIVYTAKDDKNFLHKQNWFKLTKGMKSP